MMWRVCNSTGLKRAIDLGARPGCNKFLRVEA
jgi:hypothetical protein